MPNRYDNAGLRFEFPENWLLEEGAEPNEALAQEDADTVTLYSPGGSFWTVVRRRDGDPQPYVEAALKTMREEYEDLDAEAVKETVQGHRLTGYDLNFFCLDLTNTARIRGVKAAGSTLLIFCQADDRELREIDPVFQALTASLLSNLGTSKKATWPPR
jgi:hypothetical protein